jgi:UDP-N-acetylglucosamine/UDP-N-acetyl-alpha-D-glucosaminouronate 4-epimerase
MMRVLVTGGAGFIGSHVVEALIREGEEVTVVDNLSTGYPDNVSNKAELVTADVADFDAVAEASRNTDIVFHLAAARAVLRSVQDPLATDRANTRGTLSVLEAARQNGVRRVICASSSSVYGGASIVPTPESAPLVPRSPYAVSKLAGENYARVYWELHRLETVSIRFFNVFGPRQRPESPYAAVIPIFLDALRSGAGIEVHGDGQQSRDFTYIDDAVSGCLGASRAPAEKCAGRVYNIAGGGEHSLMELIEVLERLTGTNASATHVEARAGDIRRSRADLAAAATDLEWSPAIGFEEGLSLTAAWFGARSRTD